MNPVENRVGCKINLEDKYYGDQAIAVYKAKGAKMMKFV
jgi:hypothetical protein